jgi:glycosyltransferase involved in cell wall biosynthesis
MDMKILYILGDSKFGGSTYLVIEWVRFLAQRQCRIDIHSTDPTSIAALRALDLEGVRVIDDISIPREVAPVQDIAALLRLFALIRREQYDVVHTGMTTSGFVGRLAAWLAQTPIIVHDAQGWPATEYSSVLERAVFTPLSYLAGMLSTRVVCAGHGTAALAHKLHTCPPDKLTVICNGIDPCPFLEASSNGARAALRHELGISDDCLVIGNANRLAPQKDNESLIRAMLELPALLPDHSVVLLLAGDGPDQDKLETLVRELGLTQHVRFLGFRDDIPAFLSAIDIFVNASLWEGLSISLMEAMAAARPIITSSILPNAELISHQNTGLLVEPRSPGQIAQGIAYLAQHPDQAQQYAAAAQQHVSEHYTIDRRLHETWKLYLDLIESRSIEPTSQLSRF